jgi:hypothetical protein
MIRYLLVVVVPDASDVRLVAVLPCPLDCLVLGLAGVKDVICMVLHHIILDRASLRPTRTGARTLVFTALRRGERLV